MIKSVDHTEHSHLVNITVIHYYAEGIRRRQD